MMSVERTVIFLSILYGFAACEPCFRAGVYEHILIDQNNDHVKDGDPEYYLRKNLDAFKQVVETARREGVQIIVLPEGGLFHPSNRKKAVKLSENIPQIDPFNQVLPCTDKLFKDTDRSPGILKFLSCLAQDNHLYLVADLADLQPCNIADHDCPKDGHRIFNTAVAFDPHGVLVQKYHKRHLFGEYSYDVPVNQELVTFETPWGSMGLFICFDIIYRDPGLSLIRERNVTTLLLPTAWFDEFPFLMSSQYHNAWAMGNRVNLLAADLKDRSTRTTGSGIYAGQWGPQVYLHDVNGSGLPSLLIANVPQNSRKSSCDPKSKIVTFDFGKPDRGKYPILQLPLSDFNYTYLNTGEVSEKICDGSFCCHLSGHLKHAKHAVVFGVRNKIRKSTTLTDYSWCEEACFLMAIDKTGQISTQTRALFDKALTMNAQFSTDSVYPSVLSEGLKLLHPNEWQFNSSDLSRELSITAEKPISIVGLYGRCYDRDPPYKRSNIN